MNDRTNAPAGAAAEPRSPLTRKRVLAAALAVADRAGLEALTVRRLAQELGVAPMALYRHVANKDDIVDGIVDLVFAEIAVPAAGADWKRVMRERAISVRRALMRHRWAVGLMESRATPGPANLRHHDAVIGSLRAAGFDLAEAAHAYSLMDSYIYGFALTQMSLPFESSDEIEGVAREMLRSMPARAYPNLAAMITQHAVQPGYDYAAEFEYGLDVVLDGLEQAVDRERSPVKGGMD